MQDDPELRRTLWFLVGGKRGGENRVRIIVYVREKPGNLNQIANDLGLQYKTVQHHMRILVASSLLTASGEGYGAIYTLTPWFEAHIEVFDAICAKLGLSRSEAAAWGKDGQQGPAV